MALLGTWRRVRRLEPAAIPDSECLVLPFVVVAAVGNNQRLEGMRMKIRIGVDIACRSRTTRRPHPLRQSCRSPVLLGIDPQAERVRAHRPRRRTDQARRRMPARCAVPSRRPRPQSRPHPRGPLPAMCNIGRHHNSATCTVAAVLLTRIVACLRNGIPYELRDVDGTPITDTEGRAIVAQRYQIPAEIRDARRSISKARTATRRNERVKKGVARRSETPLAPPAACPHPTPLATVRNSTAASSPPETSASTSPRGASRTGGAATATPSPRRSSSPGSASSRSAAPGEPSGRQSKQRERRSPPPSTATTTDPTPGSATTPPPRSPRPGADRPTYKPKRPEPTRTTGSTSGRLSSVS
jgi:hypothetical protein